MVDSLYSPCKLLITIENKGGAAESLGLLRSADEGTGMYVTDLCNLFTLYSNLCLTFALKYAIIDSIELSKRPFKDLIETLKE